MEQRPLIITVVSALCLLFFVLFTFLPLLVPSYRAKGQLWNGYYTILIKRGTAYRDFLAQGGWNRILKDSDAAGRVISETTQTVEFSSFEGLDVVRVDHLEGRFDPLDPRLDPYMKRLIHFFKDGGEWMRFYVPSRTPAFRFFIRLLLAFPGYGRNWRLVDFDIYGKALSLLLSLAFLIILYFTKRQFQYRWVLLLGYVPWFFTLVSGDFYDLISFYLLFSAWYLVIEDSLDMVREYVFFGWLRPDRERLQYRYVFLGGAFLLTTVLRMLSGQPGKELVRNLSPLIATFMLTGAYILSVQIHYFTHEHLIFSPIRIIGGSRGNLREGCIVGMCLLVVVTPFLLLIGGPTSKLSVPVPTTLAGSSSFSWRALELLWQSKSRNPEPARLPDIAEYVVHMAFQEGLPYGGPYGKPYGKPYGEAYSFPTRGHTLTVSNFQEDRQNHRIMKTSQVVVTYDEDWLAKTLDHPELGSVERMLLDQSKPLRIVLQSVGSVLPGFSFWKSSVLLLFVLFVLFSFDFICIPVLIYSGKNQEKIINRKAT